MTIEHSYYNYFTIMCILLVIKVRIIISSGSEIDFSIQLHEK